MANKSLTADRLREVLDYNPESGDFTEKRSRSGTKKKAGDKSGWIMVSGYRAICIDAVQYAAHRLAFLYMTGEMPKHHVDHINGDRVDNRWSNLRDVPATTNLQNLRQAMSSSASGLLGASWDKLCGKWRAQIRLNGTQTYIGSYATAEEAHAAYVAAKRVHHEGCTI